MQAFFWEISPYFCVFAVNSEIIRRYASKKLGLGPKIRANWQLLGEVLIEAGEYSWLKREHLLKYLRFVIHGFQALFSRIKESLNFSSHSRQT